MQSHKVTPLPFHACLVMHVLPYYGSVWLLHSYRQFRMTLICQYPNGKNEDLTGSSHFPSRHTQHHHLTSCHNPADSLNCSHLTRVSHYLRMVTNLSCRRASHLLHLGLPVRLRVFRLSASPSDTTSRWCPRLVFSGYISIPKEGLSPSRRWTFWDSGAVITSVTFSNL